MQSIDWAVKIKTHVNKQQLRPRALPKIDVHAHTHAAHTRLRDATPAAAEKSIFWAKLLPLAPLCVSGLLLATENPMPDLPPRRGQNQTLSVTQQSTISSIKRGGSCTAGVLGSSVPLRSIGWVGRAAAWRRPSTPARSLPRDGCTLLPRTTHPVLVESWTRAALTLTRCTVRWTLQRFRFPVIYRTSNKCISRSFIKLSHNVLMNFTTHKYAHK